MTTAIESQRLHSVLGGAGPGDRSPCVERAEVIANAQLAEWIKQNPSATDAQIRVQARVFMEPLLKRCR
jgi:hypothetical protein